MKKCKRIVASLLTLCTVLSISACGLQANPSVETPDTDALTPVSSSEAASSENTTPIYSLIEEGTSEAFAYDEGDRWTKEDSIRIEPLVSECLIAFNTEDVDAYMECFTEEYFATYPGETREFVEDLFNTYDIRPKFLNGIIISETETEIVFRMTVRYENTNDAEYTDYDAFIRCEMRLVDGRWMFDDYKYLEYSGTNTVYYPDGYPFPE